MSSQRTTSTAARIAGIRGSRGIERTPRQRSVPARRISASGAWLSIGAKTVAGVGLGLFAVLAGSVVLGLAAEAVLIPSLAVKLAGVMAGGGVGMAKGIKDEGRRR